MIKTDTSLTPTTLKQAIKSLAIEVYSLTVWLLILIGGMVVVSSFLVPNLEASELIGGILVGIVSIGFGIAMTRLLSKDIRQTAPVFWF